VNAYFSMGAICPTPGLAFVFGRCVCHLFTGAKQLERALELSGDLLVCIRCDDVGVTLVITIIQQRHHFPLLLQLPRHFTSYYQYNIAAAQLKTIHEVIHS